jgi:hypothetical protein
MKGEIRVLQFSELEAPQRSASCQPFNSTGESHRRRQ